MSEMIQQGTEQQVLPVLIIGAGPVGLLLANRLGENGLPVVVAEQRTSPEWSRAIGITPPSLNIFKSLALHETLETRGVCVDKAVVHDDRGPAGRVSFAHLDSEFRHILAGDAAHVMSPIGGQGMNSGFADAELVATILPRLLDGEPAEPLLAAYDRCRQRAVRSARRRAAFGMWVGTRTGRISSGLRNLAVRGVMGSPLAKLIPPHFAMLTIPYNSADKTELPRQ